VHLTRKIDGTVVLGPNAILSTARHAYERRRFVARDAYEAISWPGTLRMLRRHWRAGLHEIVRSASKRQFVREVARYVPAVSSVDVLPAPAGVRAQAIDRDGSLVDDFRLGTTGHVTWVRNAPSPAATSSLAIAEELVTRAG
jgi:L-2-hydroxyglutarate oxidase LhgO